MSDYTTTPTLGLYKPTEGADADAWGSHLNLNADMLDTAYRKTGAYVGAEPPGSALAPMWWNSADGQLYVQYNDGNSIQWVVANSGAGSSSQPFVATGATAARSSANRWAEPYSVKDFGAVMNGVASDTAAFTAAINATPDMGTIYVPPGGINVPGLTAATSTKRILWRMSGNRFGTGSTAVSGLGNGVVETFLANSTKFFSRASSLDQPGIGPVVRVDMTLNHADGTTGGIEALQVNASTTATSTANAYPFALTATLTMRSTQASGPPGCCFSAVAQRMLGAGPANLFAMNPQVTDFTTLPSGSGGSMVTAEFNLKANKLDDGTLADGRTMNGAAAIPGVNRCMLDLKYLRTDRNDNTPMECGVGLNIGLSTELDLPYCSMKSGIRINHKITWAAINLHPVLFQGNANAILMGDGARVAWSPDDPEAGVVPTHFSYLQYRAATSRLYYVVNGVDKFSIDASGNVRAAGTITGSVTP